MGCQLIMSNIENKSPEDGHGSTPLHYAAFMGRHHICKLFIENNQKLSVKNKSFHTPYDLAMSNNCYDVGHLIESAIENPEKALRDATLKERQWKRMEELAGVYDPKKRR